MELYEGVIGPETHPSSHLLHPARGRSRLHFIFQLIRQPVEPQITASMSLHLGQITLNLPESDMSRASGNISNFTALPHQLPDNLQISPLATTFVTDR